MTTHREKTLRSRRVRPRANRERKAFVRPRSLKAFRKLSQRQRDDYVNSTNTVAKMRTDGLSLAKAAQVIGTDPQTVIRLAHPALRKDKRGRWTTTKRDSLLRVLTVPSGQGSREIVVKDSRTAVQIANYFEAIRRYAGANDASVLKPFRQLRLVDAQHRPIRLVTNRRVLDELGHAGLLSFESLYARTV